MKIIFVNKTFPDNPRLQDFDKVIPLCHYWRSLGIAFFVAMIFVIILQLGVDYIFHVNPEYSLSVLQGLAFLCVTLMFHELLHLVFLVKHRKELYFVVQPKALAVGFVVDDFVKRQEMLTVLVAPLFFLSFIPYLTMMIFGRFAMNVFIIVCLNLYISIGDIVMFRFIERNSDRHAFVHFANGFLHIRHTGRNFNIPDNP